MASVVIVTRPARAGRRLGNRIVQSGFEAVWWPAFSIGPAPDVPAARAALARVADYQLAIFVSVHAVDATRELLAGPWPTQTMIGAIGRSTRMAVEAELKPPPTSLIAPLDDDETGSEAFWRAWQARLPTPRSVQRVLLLRAEERGTWTT